MFQVLRSGEYKGQEYYICGGASQGIVTVVKGIQNKVSNSFNYEKDKEFIDAVENEIKKSIDNVTETGLEK